MVVPRKLSFDGQRWSALRLTAFSPLRMLGITQISAEAGTGGWGWVSGSGPLGTAQQSAQKHLPGLSTWLPSEQDEKTGGKMFVTSDS